MSLGKRHIGRRVAGVGVAVALMMLGLAAPASAVLGPITFAPASGPNGCVIVITGTDFQGPDVDDVEINLVNVTDFEIQSDTEIWATANGESGFVTVKKSATGEAVSSGTQFTDTSGDGGCASTITSFTPTCGTVGTTVTITGTNLVEPSGSAYAGAFTEFSPFTATDGIDATHTGAGETPTSLSVLVPTGAKTGPISVQTDVSEVFSAADFTVVTDPALCVPPEPTTHARSISLSLSGHVKAKGKVTSTEDPAFTDCVGGVPVKIQRKTKSGWKTVGTATTSDTGSYSKKVKDKAGRYRAIAKKVGLGDPVTDTCSKATSAVRKHKH